MPDPTPQSEIKNQKPEIPPPPPYNPLRLDYHAPPPRKAPGPIIDAHCHAHSLEPTRVFVDAGRAYGITHMWSMTPLEEVPALNAAFPDFFTYIAIPKWQEGAANEAFISDWQRRLDAHWDLGSRVFKLHMAPFTKKKWGMDLHHPLLRRVIQHAYQRGYHFMSHVGDPKLWFTPPNRYSNPADFGTFDSQFPPLDELLAQYPDRKHWGAHMGGSLEDLPALAARLDRFPQYFIDTSATKWIVRAVADHERDQPGSLRNFILKYQDRIMFGSDLVVGKDHPWEHYASRYYAHQLLWETGYNGPSPIDDPDVPTPPGPQLRGLDLPREVLRKLYSQNALTLIPRSSEFTP